MDRTAVPWCNCCITTLNETSMVQHARCIMDAEECPDDSTPFVSFIGQPYVVKPTAIRANKGHRSWMTHLPLSRPGPTLQATAI